MTSWKRLTLDGTNVQVDVNFDHVIYMYREHDRTRLFFIGGPNDDGRTRSIEVNEIPDDIHLKPVLRSFAG